MEQNAKAAVAKKIGLIDGLVVRAGVFYYDQIFLRYAGGANTIPKPVILGTAKRRAAASHGKWIHTIHGSAITSATRKSAISKPAFRLSVK